MAYYPIFLELEGRRCLVIGAGDVAFRKAKALASYGARVKVVSPMLRTGLRRLVREGRVRWVRHLFRPADLEGAEFVVAATNDQSVNEQASRWARKQGILINVVDQPRLCSFIFPSVVRRGKLTLAISTGGTSPALAKWIRKDLENRYGSEFSRLLDGMGKARHLVKQRIPSASSRKQLFEKALAAYFQVIGTRYRTVPGTGIA